MPVGAAEQGATGMTQGLAVGDKGLPLSEHDFLQSKWPQRGQAGMERCRPHKAEAMGSLTVSSLASLLWLLQFVWAYEGKRNRGMAT